MGNRFGSNLGMRRSMYTRSDGSRWSLYMLASVMLCMYRVEMWSIQNCPFDGCWPSPSPAHDSWTTPIWAALKFLPFNMWPNFWHSNTVPGVLQVWELEALLPSCLNWISCLFPANIPVLTHTSLWVEFLALLSSFTHHLTSLLLRLSLSMLLMLLWTMPLKKIWNWLKEYPSDDGWMEQSRTKSRTENLTTQCESIHDDIDWGYVRGG